MGSQLQKPLIGTQVNWGHPLSRGIVACWLMNEGAGDRIYDLSLNGNDGVFVNDPTWIAGRTGQVIDFDRIDAYVNCGNTARLNPTNSITISVWFKTVDGQAAIITKDNSSSRRQWFILIHGSYNGHISGAVWNSTGSFAQPKGNAGENVDDGNLHFVSLVYGGGNVILYIDGAETSRSVLTGDLKVTDEIVRIGELGLAGWDFNGQIYSAYIYNRALSPQEVSELYLNPYGMFEHTPIWMMAQRGIARPLVNGSLVNTGLVN